MSVNNPGKKQQEQVWEKVQEIFSAYLEEHKLRKTPERSSILREVYSLNDHFDVDSLYIHMKSRKYPISRATIYNTIEHLLACDLITRHQFGKNLALFEKSYAYKQHDHLICLDCDKVLEFCDPRIQQIQSMMGELLDFKVQTHSLNLYGRCNKWALHGECENKKAKKPVSLP